MMNKPGNDYYFWLGEDGETEYLSKEEFDSRQQELRQNLDDFLNVRIPRKND